MKLGEIVVDPRYSGPPGCGHGGYVSGLLAGFAAEPVAVRLRHPAPFAIPLEVHATDAGLELRRRELVIAEARPEASRVAVPRAPDFAQASEMSAAFAAARNHPIPNCFGCGTARGEADGLRIFPGPGPAEGGVAAPWRPHAALAGTRGQVRPEFQWAALDCPGYWALATARLMVTAVMSLTVVRNVEVGEPCVVMAWKIAATGRRHRVGMALIGAAGDLVARGESIWMEPRSNGPT